MWNFILLALYVSSCGNTLHGELAPANSADPIDGRIEVGAVLNLVAENVERPPEYAEIDHKAVLGAGADSAIFSVIHRPIDVGADLLFFAPAGSEIDAPVTSRPPREESGFSVLFGPTNSISEQRLPLPIMRSERSGIASDEDDAWTSHSLFKLNDGVFNCDVGADSRCVHAPRFVQRIFAGLSAPLRLFDGPERSLGGKGGEYQGRYQAARLQPANENLPVGVASLIYGRLSRYSIAWQLGLVGAFAVLTWGLIGFGLWRWDGGRRGLGYAAVGLTLLCLFGAVMVLSSPG
ncbi:hypothetical protein [Novosphingobium sp.]|uniref:hypothetical protein n=1 Tax=Novosphingobium sp. TaxID=1874826 RepID=UPI0025E41A19|nr:hypothetical protein [Novosphingobium sp.]